MAEGALALDELQKSLLTGRGPESRHLRVSRFKAGQNIGAKPRDIATTITGFLQDNPLLERTEIAGPGFINFICRRQRTRVGGYRASAARRIWSLAARARQARPGRFVSLTDGPFARWSWTWRGVRCCGCRHPRCGRLRRGARVLRQRRRSADEHSDGQWCVIWNSAARQSRFRHGYQGDYIFDIAADIHREQGDIYQHTASAVLAGLPADEANGGDKEIYIDALSERAKSLLGVDAFRAIFDVTLDVIRGDIEKDLAGFGVVFQNWFSELSLVEGGAVEAAIERLREAGHLYEDGGALWFRSTDFGDEKDRVVVRDNGVGTYFASDIAYHLNKLERGFDRCINVWGADHHGYIPRVKGALAAAGEDSERLEVLIVQFANLFRGKEKVSMSTRSGEFVTLRELREEVGKDAARFFYSMRKNDQHLDFDLELAKSESKDNPVYYVQYAHARVCSMFARAQERGLSGPQANGTDLTPLVESDERDLMLMLSRYPEVVESAAQDAAPHLIAHYVRDLAGALHQYYDKHKILVDDEALRGARMALTDAVRIVLANGLGLLGVSAPEQM